MDLKKQGYNIIVSVMTEALSIYEASISMKSILVLGNESRGISEDIMSLAEKKVMIPRGPGGDISVESLNVAISASIFISEITKQFINVK